MSVGGGRKVTKVVAEERVVAEDIDREMMMMRVNNIKERMTTRGGRGKEVN